MKMNKTERIAMLKRNLDENQTLYQSGKRSRCVYLRCKKDGQSAVGEITHMSLKRYKEIYGSV